MRYALVIIAVWAVAYQLGHARSPIRGIAYQALPTKTLAANMPAKDLMQIGYLNQWGPDGRFDLEVMKHLGANTVRVYSGLGSEGNFDHSYFLNKCKDMGISVQVGFHSQGYCPNFDCYNSWKTAAEKGFANGFERNGKWHPAVTSIVLIDEPDSLNFHGNPDGSPPACEVDDEPKCRTRAVLSALEGVLAAEESSDVDGSDVMIGVAWSFAIKTSVDGKVTGSAIYGFQDMVVGIADPSIVEYTFKTTGVADVFKRRWFHATNSAAPWSYIKEKVGSEYSQFEPTPWMLTEITQDTTGPSASFDLADMDEAAAAGGSFLGVIFGPFQHDYVANTSIGMFGLGKEQEWRVDPCYEDVMSGTQHCFDYPVFCLDAALTNPFNRASSAAFAWGGRVRGQGLCRSSQAVVI